MPASLPIPALAAFAGLLGAVIGSFLNVVAWRLPRQESLVRPASRCPSCSVAIKPWHNLPIVGWLLVRGRCASCGERVSPRYPVVEAATAVLLVAVVLVDSSADRVWLGVALMLLLVPITLIDLDHRIIPNKLTLIGAVVAPLLLLAFDPGELPEHLAWGAGAGGVFFLIVMIAPRGMGMGDAKLAGVLGLFLGRAVAPAVLVALLVGSVVGAAIMARRGVAEGRKTKVPFGPFLAVGGVVGWFFGEALVSLYLDSFA